MNSHQLRGSWPAVDWKPSFAEPLLAPGRAARRFASLGATWWGLRGETPTKPGTLAHWRAAADRLQAVTAALCERNGVEIDIRGQRPPQGCIVVANHVSYVDTLALPSLLPCTCISKQEMAEWPVIGAVAVRLGVLFVRRESALSGALVLRRAIRALQAGVAVIAFPEGTTTRGDDLLPFKRGIFGIARHLGVPVVAAALSYANPGVAWVGDTGFFGHYVKNVARRHQTVVRVAFSAPLDSRAWPSAAALAEAARHRIADELFGSTANERARRSRLV